MLEKEMLKKLTGEAQEILDRLIKRFERYDIKEVKDKTIELKASAKRLNKQLDEMASLDLELCTREKVRIADDIVFQLSVFDDICHGYLEGI